MSSRLEQKRKALEERKRRLAELKAKREQEKNKSQKEQDIITKARKLVEDKRKDKEEEQKKQEEKQKQEEEEAKKEEEEKTNKDLDLTEPNLIYRRKPKKKEKGVDVAVQVDIESDDEDNISYNQQRDEDELSVAAESKIDEEDGSGSQKKKAENKRAFKVLGANEAKVIMESENFKMFLRFSSKHVEKVLFKSKSIFEMIGDEDLDEMYDEGEASVEANEVDDDAINEPEAEAEAGAGEEDVLTEAETATQMSGEAGEELAPEGEINQTQKTDLNFKKKDKASRHKRHIKNSEQMTMEEIKKSEEAKKIITFEEQYHTTGCMVSDLSWNLAIPQLALVSYCKKDPKEDQYEEYPGKTLIWNANNSTRPEFLLSAKNRITKSCFDTFSSSLVYGGLASGHLVLWDVRTQRTPVQKINPSAKTHCSPIYGLSFIGSRNSSNIVSISNDGRLCIWSPSKLSEPMKKIDLTFKPKGNDKQWSRGGDDMDCPIAPMVMTTPLGVTNNIYVGTFDKTIYNIILHPSDKNHFAQTLEGHHGPVCGLDYLINYKISNSPTNGLLVSSSFDWNIKLWNPKTTTKPIYTLEYHQDFVTDVKWNPIHPAKFLSTDVNGKVCIWNLLKSRDIPCAEFQLHGTSATKARWNVDGLHFAVGDSEARVHVYKQKKLARLYNEENLDNFMEIVTSLSSND